ncbi:AsmA family protein [Coprobacter tertius]|uniref:AsmA-like C-terminal domain-containing protein n=1 Tax=Coprobacter tertius TaxID=2944915 RepID=A0ABT1MLK8_9BACT|nr:AsmA-like C-terminal region-containing protein [Coprobacter tertius]MCP9612156.1 hypothetical protein [Coprobacter tertius]
MNKRIKRTIKITFISLLSIFLILSGIIAFALHFIFTPEKLTPVVVEVSNKMLNAKVDIKKVELTFFSSFPRFELQLSDGSIQTLLSDSVIPQKRDSLIHFGRCEIAVNPMRYFFKNEFILNRLMFKNAGIYAYVAPDGKANWNIIKPDTAVTDTSTSNAQFNGSIQIRKVEFENISLVFDDRSNGIYTSIDSLNLKLKASLTSRISKLAIKTNCNNLIFWQNGELLARRLSLGFSGDISVDSENNKYEVKDAFVNVNNLSFKTNGSAQRDTVNNTLAVDLNYELAVPSVETLLEMIPASVVKKDGLKANGSVEFSGNIKGIYGKDQIPEVTLNVKIKDASGKYKGMPYGIDNLSADFDFFVDMMRKKQSYATLKIFRFRGAQTDILADGKVSDLLGDPFITFNTKSKIDFNGLSKIFPLSAGVSIGGELFADLHFKGHLSSLKNKDIGRLFAQGEVNMKNVLLKDTLHKFDFRADASVLFKGNKTLETSASIQNILMTSPRIKIDMADFSAGVSLNGIPDTTGIIPMKGNISLKKLKGSLGDSIRVFSGLTDLKINVKPSKKDKKKPIFNFIFETDSLFMKAGKNKMGMDKAGFNITLRQNKDSLWIPSGVIGFRRLKMITDALSLPIYMGNTRLTMERHTIALNSARMRIGESNLLASGSVRNLLKAMTGKGILMANLDITSDMINCNQILSALSPDIMTSTDIDDDSMTFEDEIKEGEEEEQASDNLHLFIIPDNLELVLHTKVKKALYNKMVFEKVNGLIEVKDRAVHLKNLSMRALDANMSTHLLYKATDRENAYTGFDFNIKNINIGKLVYFIPELDTIVPMLRSFKGLVDFNIAAEAELDSVMNVHIPSLRSAIYVKGDSLVLLDGDTFRKLSKLLMFKNKKQNLFDSISVNITVDKGNVKVYPFLVEIDRYKAAVGGEQKLDMTFNYHVSILKSPLPFKAGVDIYGNIDKVKFRITRAKYKNLVSPAQIREIDSTRMNMGRMIIDHFRRMTQ